MGLTLTRAAVHAAVLSYPSGPARRLSATRVNSNNGRTVNVASDLAAAERRQRAAFGLTSDASTVPEETERQTSPSGKSSHLWAELRPSTSM